jgi:hypothetical protein
MTGTPDHGTPSATRSAPTVYISSSTPFNSQESNQ